MSTLPQVGEIGMIQVAIIRPFGELWTESRPRVYRTCFRFVRDPDLADDMASEVFLRAWRHRDTFLGTCQFSTWLHRIAVNTCLEHIRRQKARPNGVSLDEMREQFGSGESGAYMDAVSSRDRHLDGYADRETMLLAIGELPILLRVPVILSEIEGYTHVEISGLLGVGKNAVKSRVFRGKRELGRILGAPVAAPKRRAYRRRFDALESYA